MISEERIEVMLQALVECRSDNDCVVHIEDVEQPEHWVRVHGFGHGLTTHLEVTNRATPGSLLPPLTRTQIDQLVDLGLGPEARPNFEGNVPETDPVTLARRIDQIFGILRSSLDFDVRTSVCPAEDHEPNLFLLDIYGGMPRAPKRDEDHSGDPELLARILEAQAVYRIEPGTVADAGPPYVVTCMPCDGEYRSFVDEESIMLRSLSLSMQAGHLTGAQAREAYRPYSKYAPEIYAPDYLDWNEWGFPVCTDDQDELMSCSITHGADDAGIPGVGVPWGDLSPMSGEPLIVEGDTALQQLRDYFEGGYVIISTGDETWWDLHPDEAQRRIEDARTGATTSDGRR